MGRCVSVRLGASNVTSLSLASRCLQAAASLLAMKRSGPMMVVAIRLGAQGLRPLEDPAIVCDRVRRLRRSWVKLVRAIVALVQGWPIVGRDGRGSDSANDSWAEFSPQPLNVSSRRRHWHSGFYARRLWRWRCVGFRLGVGDVDGDADFELRAS